MQIILTAQQMRQLEQDYMQATGTPSRRLMLRAATELADAMDRHGLVQRKHIAFLCSCGGNGGDGLAAATLCRDMGAHCRVVLAQPPEAFTGDAAYYLAQLPSDIPVCSLDEADDVDVWVDALFGIGLNRTVSAPFDEYIDHLNRSGATIVSVDIPSGLHADTGDVLNHAVRANLTVTFQHPKRGHFLRHGPDCSGELVVRDIGLPPPDSTLPLLFRPENSDIAALLPRRKHFSHKGTYGHLLIVAGSRGMAGAAAIAARAALHSGAGLVTIACPAEIVPILQTLAPEAMCLPLAQNESGAISAEALPALQNALSGKTCVAIGPGLSRKAAPEIVRAVLESRLPAVIDADALNLIAANSHLKELLAAHHIITPHPGEAARLLPPSGSEIADAQSLRAFGCQAICKGAVSVIAAADAVFLSDTGSPCMAKGGSGDMLTGIAGALLAQRLAPASAALAASHIHGLAGEAAQRRFGLFYPTATDMIGCLSEVWKELGV